MENISTTLAVGINQAEGGLKIEADQANGWIGE